MTTSLIEENTADNSALTSGNDFISCELSDFPIPSSNIENWRFTPLRRLRHIHDIAEDNIRADDYGEIQYRVDAHAQAGNDFQFTECDRNYPNMGRIGYPIDRVSALAFKFFQSAAALSIDPYTKIMDPIHLHITTVSSGNSLGHLQIHVSNFAEATLIIHYAGSGLLADNIEFIIEDGAKLTFIVLEKQNSDAVHIGAHYIRLSHDAAVQSFLIQTGAELSRVSTQVYYAGAHSDAQLYGLYIAGSGQFLEQRIKVDHTVPQCSSHVHYRGVLYDSNSGKSADKPVPAAHTVWVGDVLIRAAAQGTDTYEVNRNLLLNPGTRADSVPNLEIETGDIIGAGHASTISKFDDDQLFYLLSRGIPEKEAKKLVVRGFFAEILHKIPAESAQESLESYIEQVLAQAGV